MKLNSTNQFTDGQELFAEGQNTGFVCLVLKGKVELTGKGFSAVLGPGALLGANDGSEEISSYTCTAREGATVYAFDAAHPTALGTVLASNREYAPIAVATLARFVQELMRQHRALKEYSDVICKQTKEMYSEYLKLVKEQGVGAGLIPEIPQLEEFTAGIDLEEKQLKKVLELCAVPYEAVKAFYGCTVMMALDIIRELSVIKEQLIDACSELAEYIESVHVLMIGDKEYGLYRNLLGTGLDLKAKGKNAAGVEALVGKCLEAMALTKERLVGRSNRGWVTDETVIRGMKASYDAGEDFRGVSTQEETVIDGDTAVMLDSLKNSLDQILNFCSYPADKEETFRKLFDEYCAMPDKESTDDEYRKLRRSIADVFYDLYEHVFLTAIELPRVPKAVELFLDYGYVSETLLKEDQIIELLKIKNDNTNEPCVVYTLREWLTLVYNGEKEPSRNDMGQDYAEVLREMKKRGTIDEKGEKELLQSGAKKLEYEVKEVLAHGSRIVNGQLSTFVPILHSEMMIGDLVRAFNSRGRINDAVEDLTSIDYSIFYREALYIDPKKKIEKEYMMKQVFPVFILYPTIGQNVIMWQEITGRRRDTEGRFFVPAFSFASLRDMMIKAFGQYRWSLCKTIQGTNWNNIQVRSLTSEYSDYIQFFKKNKDLSEERREKIKLQIQRGRNNLREVFTLDYIAWMRNEAAGAIKLNKVAREILAMWCPFSVSLKEQLIKQPLYEEAFARNARERNKKTHELDMRFRSFESKGITVPPELTHTLEYYRDM